MKKRYIAPQTEMIEMETEQFIALSPTVISPTVKLKPGTWMQYDGDQLHTDFNVHSGSIAGPASEYVGTDNDQNPVDESDIFN